MLAVQAVELHKLAASLLKYQEALVVQSVLMVAKAPMVPVLKEDLVVVVVVARLAERLVVTVLLAETSAAVEAGAAVAI